MRPKNLSGVGTTSDAGRWSTSSVITRGSAVYSLIFAVYSASIFCDAALFDAGAFDCAARFDAATPARTRTARTDERRVVRMNIKPPAAVRTGSHARRQRMRRPRDGSEDCAIQQYSAWRTPAVGWAS